MWLNILAVRKESVADIMAAHWRTFGRNYYSRHDFEALDTASAEGMLADLASRLDGLAGVEIEGMIVEKADSFSYVDPVDQSVSSGQGYRIQFQDGSRIVLRLSGTGTSGATLRVYLERFTPGPDGLNLDPQDALAPVIRAAHELVDIKGHVGRDTPDVIT